MNKTILLIFAAVFGLAGSYLPFLFGDKDLFSPWSILCGTIGGLIGIWVGVKISKAMS